VLPTKFQLIWPIGFREYFFFRLANHKQELPIHMAVMEILYRLSGFRREDCF